MDKWTKNKAMYKHLKELIPIFTVLLIFLSYVNMQAYYEVIGIDIYNYIDTTELLLSFIPFIYDWLFYGSILLLVALWILTWIVAFFIEKKSGELLNQAITVIKRYETALLIIILIIKTVIIIIFIAFESSSLWYNVASIAFFSVIVILILAYNINNSNYKSILLIISFFSVMFLSSLMQNNVHVKGQEALNRMDNYISFTYYDTHIQTDSLNLFYGETKNYIFFYNLSDSTSKIYEKIHVTNISYSKHL